MLAVNDDAEKPSEVSMRPSVAFGSERQRAACRFLAWGPGALESGTEFKDLRAESQLGSYFHILSELL